MEWSTTTYAGKYALGSPSRYRTSMFELCRGVNERELAIGLTSSSFPRPLTKFAVTTGSNKSNVTMDDLYLLPCCGVGNKAAFNLNTIRNGIVSLASMFTESSTSFTLWTTETLSDAVGFDLSQPAERVNQAAFWQACQDALDLLIYARGRWPISYITFSGGNGRFQTTVAAAYADRFYNPTPAGFDINALGVTMREARRFTFPPEPLGSWRCLYTNSKTFVVGSDSLWSPGDGVLSLLVEPSGVITAAFVEYIKNGVELIADIQGNVHGTDVVIGNGQEFGITSIPTWTLGDKSYPIFTVTLPVSNPFEEESDPLNDTNGGGASLVFYKCHTIIDISSQITNKPE